MSKTTEEYLEYIDQSIDSAYTAVNQKSANLPADAPLEELSAAILRIPSGEPPHEVRFLDIDGSIISSKKYNSGENATFPTPPVREGLIFDKWTHTQEDLNNIQYRESERGLKIPGHIDVGACYKTADSTTHITAVIRSAYSMSVGIYFVKVGAINAQISVDWGDGFIDNFAVSTGLKTHAYSREDTFHIEIWSDNTYGLGNNATNSSICTTGKECITKVYFADNVLLRNYACYGLKALEEVSLPSNTSFSGFGAGFFDQCSVLKHCTIPRGHGIIGNNFLSNCIGLESVVIPPDIIDFGSFAFSLTPKLKRLVFPKGINSFSDSLFTTGSTSELISDTIRTLGNNGMTAWYLSGTINLANEVRCSGTGGFANAYSLELNNLKIIFTSILTGTPLTWLHLVHGTIEIQCEVDSPLPSSLNLNSCDKLIVGSNFSSITGDIISAGISTYVFQATVPPAIASITYLNKINKLARIFVPDESVADYKVAAGWSAVSSFIYPMSMLP